MVSGAVCVVFAYWGVVTNFFLNDVLVGDVLKREKKKKAKLKSNPLMIGC